MLFYTLLYDLFGNWFFFSRFAFLRVCVCACVFENVYVSRPIDYSSGKSDIDDIWIDESVVVTNKPNLSIISFSFQILTTYKLWIYLIRISTLQTAMFFYL